MSEPAAPEPPNTPQAGGSGVQVPASRHERIEINNKLIQAAAEAWLAKDRDLLELRQLQQVQFQLACDIADLERAPASDLRREDLPSLRSSLAAVNVKLQQQQQQ